MSSHPATEIDGGSRFAFGENWARFLTGLDEDKIRQAEKSLAGMLKVNDLRGKRFLDIGSGSGLFSLAARRLGATVHSFDYDPRSVGCTSELKHRYFPDDESWIIEQGSVLDEAYVSGLGRFDVVYSWGVLHHTGRMMAAFANVIPAVAVHGRLFIAIYNDQGLISKYWRRVKRAYNKNRAARFFLIALHLPYLVGLRWLVDDVVEEDVGVGSRIDRSSIARTRHVDVERHDRLAWRVSVRGRQTGGGFALFRGPRLYPRGT